MSTKQKHALSAPLAAVAVAAVVEVVAAVAVVPGPAVARAAAGASAGSTISARFALLPKSVDDRNAQPTPVEGPRLSKGAMAGWGGNIVHCDTRRAHRFSANS